IAVPTPLVEPGASMIPTTFPPISPNSSMASEGKLIAVPTITSTSSTAEAARLAYEPPHAATASTAPANAPRAHRMAQDSPAGTVTVKCYGEGDIATPFGGFKPSGFGGRDKSLHAHDQYTELKTIWADISDPRPTQTLD